MNSLGTANSMTMFSGAMIKNCVATEEQLFKAVQNGARLEFTSGGFEIVLFDYNGVIYFTAVNKKPGLSVDMLPPGRTELVQQDQSLVTHERKNEIIAKQAVVIDNLEALVKVQVGAFRSIRQRIYCTSGPLNGNVLGYSNNQLVTFLEISRTLDEVY